MKINKKIILSILFFTAACAATSYFLFNIDILSKLGKNILFTCLCLIFLTAVISSLLEKTTIFRLMITVISLALFFAVLFYIFDKSGFWDNISTKESLQAFIKEKGMYSSLVFLAIQILQVVAIPLPGALTVSIGNILFGVVWGSVLSYIGIIIGSLMAFFVGRVFGYKLVVWIVGEENLNKFLNMIKGRDKIMLTMMFLLPFFPDDLLCFVAGVTTMSWFFFTGMVLTTRIVTIAATAFFVEFIQNLIYSGTVLGYIVLTIMGAVMLFLFYYTTRHGEKIQTFFENKYNRFAEKRKNKKINTVNNK